MTMLIYVSAAPPRRDQAFAGWRSAGFYDEQLELPCSGGPRDRYRSGQGGQINCDLA